MSDFRAGVRDIVAEILARRLPELQRRVYRAREWPVQENQTPALLVYGYQEEKTADGMDGAKSSFAVSCTMAVHVMVQAAGRQTELVEQELERFCQAVCLAILTAPELLAAETGRIEEIAGVKTTLNIDARSGEKALGQALIAFDMRWHEFYALPPPAIDCDAPFLTFRVIPDPHAAAP